VVITEAVQDDSDDPAIWINRQNPEQSLILGTDKAGILFVFDLNGKIVKRIQETGMQRLNNVDIEYGFSLAGKSTDIAVVTDRDASRIFAFSLPYLERIDDGNNKAFAGSSQQRPMGIGLYKRPVDGAVFAIVSRKAGPSGAYLWQYRLRDNNQGKVRFEKIREFGKFSGLDAAGDGEIEAICVDDASGYLYYSDELAGIRKYSADPDRQNADAELAFFGTSQFTGDREGICIYPLDEKTGYILVSDQQEQGQVFQIFSRNGSPSDPHAHQHLGSVALATSDTDGCDITAYPLGSSYPRGLFVAMSNNATFHYYDCRDVLGLQP
jgi:3-phytase